MVFLREILLILTAIHCNSSLALTALMDRPDCQSMMALSRTTVMPGRFETLIPPSKQSYAALFPKSYQDIVGAYEASKDLSSVFGDFAEHAQGTEEALLSDAGADIAEVLEEIAGEVAVIYPARNDGHGLKRLLFHYAEAFRGKVAQEDERFRVEDEGEEVLSRALLLRSLWVELRMALLVPRLRAASVTVGSFVELLRASPALRFLAPIPPRGGDYFTEIDLIWQLDDDGANGTKFAWGEVKNFNQPLAVSDEPGSRWQKLLSQLKRQQRIARQKLDGVDIEIHLFLTGGITEGARRVLQSIGIIVNA